MILPAGTHYDVPAHVYHADPAPEPSLSASLAKILVGTSAMSPARTPAHARLAHPRLNPNFVPDESTKYDIGNIAHRLILGRGRELEVLPFDDWRTKDARAARENAVFDGKFAVLVKDYETASKMVLTAAKQLDERGYFDEWDPETGCGEVVAIAHVGNIEPDDGVLGHHYLRTMIDWLPSLTRIWDVKTTHMPLARAISASLPDWCIQAAMHERILNLLDRNNAGRREHRFVPQEDFPPYALQVVRLTEAHLTVGRKQIARAESIWARCMATGEWPAYPLEDQSPEYPSWAMNKIMEEDDE